MRLTNPFLHRLLLVPFIDLQVLLSTLLPMENMENYFLVSSKQACILQLEKKESNVSQISAIKKLIRERDHLKFHAVKYNSENYWTAYKTSIEKPCNQYTAPEKQKQHIIKDNLKVSNITLKSLENR